MKKMIVSQSLENGICQSNQLSQLKEPVIQFKNISDDNGKGIKMDNKSKLIDFAEHLKQADGLLITAGAGMGVDSGLPDFRGDQGFWKAYPPLKHLGKSFVDMATPELFYTDPKLA